MADYIAPEDCPIKETIKEQPTVELTPLKLPGQPATDRGFVTANGTKLRARVVLHAEHDTRAPANGDVQLAPAGVVLSLTWAQLNDDLTVATDAKGRFIVSDRHEITLSKHGQQNEAFDVQAEVERNLREDAYRFEQWKGHSEATTNYLVDEWGLDASAEPVESTLMPALESFVILPAPTTEQLMLSAPIKPETLDETHGS